MVGPEQCTVCRFEHILRTAPHIKPEQHIEIAVSFGMGLGVESRVRGCPPAMCERHNQECLRGVAAIHEVAQDGPPPKGDAAS